MLVTGCGTVGLLTMLSCRAAGATTVVCTDVVPAKLALATQLGATAALPARAAARDVLDANAAAHYDVAIECCGAEPALQLCVSAQTLEPYPGHLVTW